MLQRGPPSSTAALDSIAHVKSLLVMLLEHLELKGKKFSSFPSASEQDIDSMWETVQKIDSTIKKDESLTKNNLPSKQGLTAFLKHCCTSRHYFFQIKKCGSESCGMCGPVRLPKEVFDQLHFLPDPVPGDDSHYRAFKGFAGYKNGRDPSTLSPVGIQANKNSPIFSKCSACKECRYNVTV